MVVRATLYSDPGCRWAQLEWRLVTIGQRDDTASMADAGGAPGGFLRAAFVTLTGRRSRQCRQRDLWRLAVRSARAVGDAPRAPRVASSQCCGGGRPSTRPDTAEGADVGGSGDRLVIDLDFFYHPSCQYAPECQCRLAPSGNSMVVEVKAGERV